ncbi:MAG: hypothetical protein KDI17_04625 [Halioglobus sp.]|nr:hypothetical protein [Halioglobus sp.]
MNDPQSIDVKNLSSRKLWELVHAMQLPQAQHCLAEQELLLRRRYLEHSGNLHPSSHVNRICA